MSISEESREIHVLIIPYPAQGHMLPLLDLAHLLSLHSLAITVAVTPKNLPVLSPLLASSPSIKPLVLPFPTHPSLPPNIENVKDLPNSLASILHLMQALSGLHSPILTWARSVPNPPVAIVSDFFLGWTNKLAQQLGIPRVTFSSSGAICLAVDNYLWSRMPNSDTIRCDSLPGSPVYEWSQISTVYKCYVEGDPLSEFIKEGFVRNRDSWGFVFNTFEDLETKYLDHMRREDLGHDRVWAVGPLSLRGAGAGAGAGAGSAADRGGPCSVPAEELLAWLDGKEEGSVVYVCFGSQAALSQAQVDAVAAALERSGAHFVWCLRAGAGAAGPGEGFEERVKERGTLVRGWAPQVEVLGHGAVGWFLTHCGWNSVLEGITAGTVMLTWPMGADQFYNIRVLEEVGIGVSVCQGQDSVPDSDELTRILVETVSGGYREERRRAAELKEKALAAVEECGSSWRDVEALVEELKKLKG